MPLEGATEQGHYWKMRMVKRRATGIQTRKYDALTNAGDVSRDILDKEVIGLRHGH